MTFTAPSVAGPRARIDPFQPERDGPLLLELDWTRSLNPMMAGWVARRGLPGTAMVRDRRADPADDAVGVVDANPLPGYPGVANVSVYADSDRAKGGLVLEAYALLVDALFTQGARIIHQEILEFNGPIQRALESLGVSSSARYRDHAYVAGRWWDVLVYAFDETRWRTILDQIPNNPVRRAKTLSGPERDASAGAGSPQVESGP